MTPRATMRLQFHAGFTFGDAARLVPYLSSLGISHVYASPITTARKGSIHGYDVIDPTRVNPELGGEDGLKALVSALRREGLGLIVDIVPNHMFVGDGLNAWWEDGLANGRQSRFARMFDIDWEVDDPVLRGRVLLPILGASYGEALARGDVQVTLQDDGKRGLRLGERVLPLNDGGQRELASWDGESLAVDRLHRLLEAQHYRLAWWRTAGDEINWRRFFEVNELAGVRVEDDEVFELTHELVFRLYGEGVIDGVRVDHVDGLAHPASYCRRLRSRLSQIAKERPPGAPPGPAYIVVEKILGPGERLSPDWDVDGTSGYDFMDQVSAVLHDPAGEMPLTDLWAEVSGRPARFEHEELVARRELLDRSFSSQLDSAAGALHAVARASLDTRDISRASIRRSLVELVVHFPAYRTYAGPYGRSLEDAARFDRAAEAASGSCIPADRQVIDLLDRWLGGEIATGPDADLRLAAITRFEQLSAPIAAKAVEDTAFYRHGRMLSRTDVGFHVARFAASPQMFHGLAEERRRRFPRAMLATATHDHKRGEDVRARLAVLSEVADDWAASVHRWMAANAPLRQIVGEQPAPQPGDEAILYQMIVGAWPVQLDLADHQGRVVFAERLARWQEKAMREAKLVTDWITPHEEHEGAARDFLFGLIAAERPPEALTEIVAFARRIGPAGAVNGLTQVLTKLTSPGVPDFYQGTEFWDQSLVDPDNRSPVDFEARQASLRAVAAPRELAANWRDGRIKQWLTARVLAFRRKDPELFIDGGYAALGADGAHRDHVLAWARRRADQASVTVCCRLPARLLKHDDEIRIPAAAWGDTRLRLPETLAGRKLVDVLTGTEIEAKPEVPLGDVLRELPVALLVAA